MKSTSIREPVLVGRDQELRELSHYLDLAIDRNGHTVFISGEAGSGKTRLVQEFLKKTKENKLEIIIISGWCICNVDIPYFPFLEAFKPYPDFQKQIAISEGISPQTAKEQAFNSITQLLLAISTEKPTILFVDDIHWADSASLTLLHYIARTIKNQRVLVLATFRREDLFSDVQNKHPLIETLRLMRREDLLIEIGLTPLNDKETSLLIESAVDGHARIDLVQRIANESQGNPLFIIEALRMFSESGNLIKNKGKWHLSTEKFPIPSKVKDIILLRAEKIEPNYRKILDIASAIGARFDQTLLSSVLNKDLLELLESLQKIEQSTSLIIPEGDSYRFDHSKSREALYEEIPLQLKKVYHTRIAEVLEKQLFEGNKVQLCDLAYHFSAAEQNPKAIKYSLDAGKEALALFCGAEATRHFSFVSSITDGKKEFNAERIVALEGIGDGLFASAKCKDSVEAFEKLAEISLDNSTNLRAHSKAIRAALFLGNIDKALEIARSTAFSDIKDLDAARFNLSRAMTASWTGKPQDSLLNFASSIRMFEDAYCLADMTDALSEVSIAYTMAGRWESALMSALRSYALIDYARNLNRQGYANFALWIIFTKCGLLSQAKETIVRAFEFGKRISDPISQAWDESFTYVMASIQSEFKAAETMLGNLPFDEMRDFGKGAKLKFYVSSIMSGKLTGFRKEIKAALVQSLKGVETAEETDSFMSKCINYSNVVRQYSELGQTKKAKPYLDKMDSIFQETSLPLFSFGFMMGNFSRAVFYSSIREWDKANSFFEETLRLYHSFSPPTYIEAGIRLSYCWALLQQGKFQEAKSQYAECKKTKDYFATKFSDSNLQVYAVAPSNVEIGTTFNMRLDFVNISRVPVILGKIEGLNSDEITLVDASLKYTQGTIDLNGKCVRPFENQPVVLSVVTKRPGIISLNLNVEYVDNFGKSKTCASSPLVLSSKPLAKKLNEVLPGRITTAYPELDSLLLGGIPEGYAVALVAASSDHRQLLIRHFLEAGLEVGQTTFYITSEAETARIVAEKNRSSLYLFLCSLRSDVTVQNLPNFIELKGLESLTEIDIALTKAVRMLGSSPGGTRRACISILPDVLLQHHALVTRKWLSSLLADLKSKNFTTLAIIDPSMHSSEEVHAVLSLFDGEISITDKETEKGIVKSLKIVKLLGQKYLKDEITLV